MRVLVKWPSRSRPELFFKTLAGWLSAASGEHELKFLFSFDSKDVMSEEPALKRLQAAFSDERTRRGPSLRLSALDFEVRVGPEARTKVEAINDGVNECHWPWELLVVLSDDMVCQVDKWDSLLASESAACGGDALVHHSDGHVGAKLCTLPVMGRAYYQRFGYVYFPGYKSVFCDNEETEIAKASGRWRYSDLVVARHVHPCHDKDGSWDPLYRRNEATDLYAQDRRLFEQRRSSGAFAPPRPSGIEQVAEESFRSRPVLTVMIASLKERERRLNQLRAELQRQQLLLADPTWVEVIWSVDGGEMDVGTKRQKLLEASTGEYVCAIDDDDACAETYLHDIVETIFAAYRQDPKNPPDCVVFRGVLTRDGRPAGVFEYDLANRVYSRQGSLYLRGANHLSPIRREHALAAGFRPGRVHEDNEFSARVMPLLRTQAVVKDADGTKKILYKYQWSPTLTRTQRPGDIEKNAALQASLVAGDKR